MNNTNHQIPEKSIKRPSLAKSTRFIMATSLVVTGAFGATLAAPQSASADETNAPSIEFVEAAQPNVTVEYGGTFNPEDYVTAVNDNEDGDLSASVDVDASALDTEKPGLYPIVYSVTDADGNTTERTLYVTVAPEKPVLFAYDQYVLKGASFDRDAGVVAYAYNTDGALEDVSDRISVEGAVDTSESGEYTVTYRILDEDDKVLVSEDVTITVGNDEELAQASIDDVRSAVDADLEFLQSPLDEVKEELRDVRDAEAALEEREKEITDTIDSIRDTVGAPLDDRESAIGEAEPEPEPTPDPEPEPEPTPDVDDNQTDDGNQIDDIDDNTDNIGTLDPDEDVTTPDGDTTPETPVDEPDDTTPETPIDDVDADDNVDTTPETPVDETDDSDDAAPVVESGDDVSDSTDNDDNEVGAPPAESEDSDNVTPVTLEEDSVDSETQDSDDDTTTDATTDDESSDGKADETTDGVVLTTGNFIVGKDIDAGRYTVTNPNTDDAGNFIVYGPEDAEGNAPLKFNEIVGDSDNAVESVVVDLADDDLVQIKGTTSLLFTPITSEGDVPAADEGNGEEAAGIGDGVEATNQQLPDTGTTVPTGGIIAGLIGLLGSAVGIRKFFS